MMLMALLASALAGYYGWQYGRIAANGATAPVISVAVERQARLGKNIVGDLYQYFANYTFADAGGRRHKGRQAIGRGVYETLAAGNLSAARVVHYSRSSPDHNVIDLRALRTAFAILGAIAAALWIVVLIGLVRSWSAA